MVKHINKFKRQTMSGGHSYASSVSSSAEDTDTIASTVAKHLEQLRETVFLDFEVIASDPAILNQLSRNVVKVQSLKSHLDQTQYGFYLACEIFVNMLDNEVPNTDYLLVNLNLIRQEHNVLEEIWMRDDAERIAISKRISELYLSCGAIDRCIGDLGDRNVDADKEKRVKMLSDIDALTNRHREIMSRIVDAHQKRSSLIRELTSAEINYEAALKRRSTLASAWKNMKYFYHN